MRRSAAQWRALVSAHETSGASRREFCVRHGVAVSTFDWWRKRLSAEPHGVASVKTDASAVFVELSAPLAADTPRTAPAWDLELELGAGVVLRLRRAAAC